MQVNHNRLDAFWHQLSHIPAISDWITALDRESYARRANSEGNSYRITELAKLGRDFAGGLTSSRLAVTARFRLKNGTCLPAFLYHATSHVFNDDGVLRDRPNSGAVFAIRQMTMAFSKLEDLDAPGSKPDIQLINELITRQAVLDEKWRRRDTSFVPSGTKVNMREILRVARMLVRRVLSELDPFDTEPEHGTGATACQSSVNERWQARPRWDDKLHRCWPYDEYTVSGKEHLASLDLGTDPSFIDREMLAENATRVWYADHKRQQSDQTDPPPTTGESLYMVRRSPKGGSTSESRCGDRLSEGVVDRCSRILVVPKDYRSGRVISAEPRELMWHQKGLQKRLYSHIEGHFLTKGLVNFTDQRINQRLAAAASKPDNRYWDCADQGEPFWNTTYQGDYTGPSGNASSHDVIETERADMAPTGLVAVPWGLASLDLSNASDGLSWELVRELFPENWVQALDAVRTAYGEYDSDSDRVGIAYTMHAPMGSATCFPVMALCIWAMLTAYILPIQGPLERFKNSFYVNDKRNRIKFLEQRWETTDVGDRPPVWVYGDDIIVPTSHVVGAIEVLEHCGLTVNVSKSCLSGPFRESCGYECVNGVQVQPVYLRHSPTSDMFGAAGMVSFVNQITLRTRKVPMSLIQLAVEYYPVLPVVPTARVLLNTDGSINTGTLQNLGETCGFQKRGVTRSLPVTSPRQAAEDWHGSVLDKSEALTMPFELAQLANVWGDITPQDGAWDQLPLVLLASSDLVRLETRHVRWSADLQRYEFRYLVMEPKKRRVLNPTHHWGDVLRGIIKAGQVTSLLRKTPLHKRFVIRKVWGPVPGW